MNHFISNVRYPRKSSPKYLMLNLSLRPSYNPLQQAVYSAGFSGTVGKALFMVKFSYLHKNTVEHASVAILGTSWIKLVVKLY